MLQCVKKDQIVYCVQIKKKEDYRYLIDIPPEYITDYNKELKIKWMIKTPNAILLIGVGDWLIFEYDPKTGFPIKVISNEKFRIKYLRLTNRIYNKAVDPDYI